MKHLRIFALICGGLLLLSANAFGDCTNRGATRAEASLLHMEDLWVQSLTDRSAPELNCLLAPDFVDSNWKGESLNHDQVLQAAASRAPLPAGAQHKFEDMKARIYGSTGIVTGVSYFVYADGSEHSRARFTDVFIYRDRRWQAVAGHETPVTK